MVGMFLKDRDVQYIANKDEMLKTWRILDTWHEALANLGPEDDVEDDNPAVTILTEGAFIALVKEAARLGVLENAHFGNEDTSEEVEALQEQIESLKKQLQEVEVHPPQPPQPPAPPKSEGYMLKEMAMSTLLKLTGMSDLESLTKD